jgi:hypothetical protein
MDFNKNRENLLKQFSQIKQTNMLARRSMEATNRLKEKEKEKEKEVVADNQEIAMVEQETPVPAVEAPASHVVTEDTKPDTSQKPLFALFGAKGLFITTLRSILQQNFEIHEFNEIDKATAFLFENRVLFAVMDMDLPTDLTHCQDFFTTGKTLNHDMLCIAYQKDERLSETAQYLEKQGAIIMKKPVDRTLLIDLLKKFIAKYQTG